MIGIENAQNNDLIQDIYFIKYKWKDGMIQYDSRTTHSFMSKHYL